MQKVISLLLCLCCALTISTAQSFKAPRNLKAERTTVRPTIDGKLDEEAWTKHPWGFEGKFVQTTPNNGEESRVSSAIRILYDDDAIYVGVRMYDPNPDSIPRQSGFRDSFYDNADAIGIMFDTYNKQQNAMGFMTTVSGVQSDFTSTNESDPDPSWNALWKSQVSIDEQGWVAEFEIPYVSLRFPKKDIHTWGINFYRVSKRYNEEANWSFVDASVQGYLSQMGKLNGIENIKPPLRLSLSPYVSTYYNHDGESGEGAINTTAGMDLKLGLNESFTLDMTLIPDFGQVRADNQVLNLSAFEVRFDENRAFFTEGTELFNRNGLFYSRRVGSSFGGYDVNENEEVTSAPSDAPLINATKLSGRTSKGLGIGLFNAVTDRTHALLTDTLSGEQRKVLVDPLTNFNTVVFEQNLKNNSNIAFINTNVYRGTYGRMANVTGTDFKFSDKSNTYQVQGMAAMSYISERNQETDFNDIEKGYKTFLSLAKISGNWQYRTFLNVESDTYNPNDMGFMRANNEFTYGGHVQYQKFKPFGIFNNARIRLNTNIQNLYESIQFAQMNFNLNANAQFKNFWQAGMFSNFMPMQGKDFFDPRNDGYFFLRERSAAAGGWIASDYRKRFAFNAELWAWTRPSRGQIDNGISINPSFRFTDQFNMSLNSDVKLLRNEQGYVNTLYDESDEVSNVVYGRRDVRQITNTINANYAFSSKMGLDFRLRHYWSTAAYDEYYDLDKETGLLNDIIYNDLDEEGNEMHDVNFNAFNIELTYRWEFTSSSFVSVVWKNQIYTSNDQANITFMDNLNQTLTAPQLNSLSVRVSYLLDYQKSKRFLKEYI
ncbi:DUF5916 domain-containing protein [Algivirga pacifica]|uniref:Carbohydrate family 9 binding domain-like n=1 Tax=Algivirga pacifica TaxID=1162670 RepID=A0ABP9D4C6_9BACT